MWRESVKGEDRWRKGAVKRAEMWREKRNEDWRVAKRVQMRLISGCKAVRHKVVKVKRCPAQGGWRQGGIIRHWNRKKTERCPCQQQAAGKDAKIRTYRKQSRPSESNTNPIKRKWQHQTKMPVHTAINTQIVNRKMKETNLPRGDAVSGRASEAVRHRSYRLSLVFIAISTSRNFRHPACPGSTCILIYFYSKYDQYFPFWVTLVHLVASLWPSCLSPVQSWIVSLWLGPRGLCMNTQRLCKRNLEKNNKLDTPRLNKAFYKAKVLLTIFAQFLVRNICFQNSCREIIRHQHW